MHHTKRMLISYQCYHPRQNVVVPLESLCNYDFLYACNTTQIPLFKIIEKKHFVWVLQRAKNIRGFVVSMGWVES